ncbi:MAG: hypothetical protein LBV79_10720 [Candidatus Adiutrix sp.]|jgi:hypothetical protein|nr:hypothetical protein [Candidatus Adiutrix sp.]
MKKILKKIAIAAAVLLLAAVAGLTWLYHRSNLTIEPVAITEPLAPFRIGPYLFNIPQSISKIEGNGPGSRIHFPHDSMRLLETLYANINDQDAEFEIAVADLTAKPDVLGFDDVSSEFDSPAFIVYFKQVEGGKESITCDVLLKQPAGYLWFTGLGYANPLEFPKTVYTNREELKKQALYLTKLFLADYRWTGDEPCLNDPGHKTRHGLVAAANQNRAYWMSSNAFLRGERLKKNFYIFVGGSLGYPSTDVKPQSTLSAAIDYISDKTVQVLYGVISGEEPIIDRFKTEVAGLPGTSIIKTFSGNPEARTAFNADWRTPLDTSSKIPVLPLTFSFITPSHKGTVISDLPQLLGEWQAITGNIQLVGE